MDVRLQFANEEAAEAENGVPAIHDVTPSSFISAGLDLEDQQFVTKLIQVECTDTLSGEKSESKPSSRRQRPPR